MSRLQIDGPVKTGLQIVSAGSLVIVLTIVVFLAFESWPAVSQLGWRMYWDEAWFPNLEDDPTFGLYPIAMGTVLVSAGSILIAAPVGIGSAIFSQYYAPKQVAFLYRRIVELLAGIPSVVFGFWGLTVLVPFVARSAEYFGYGQTPGLCLLSATLLIAMMILPTVMLITETAFTSVRQEYVKAAVALGIGRLAIISKIVLPQARTGIVTGIVLAIARAMGETMAVVMVAGNIEQIPDSLLDPISTLTSNIAIGIGPAVDLHRSVLFLSGLLLLTSVALLFAIEIFLRRVVWRIRRST